MEHERSRLTVWGFVKGLFKVVIGLSLLAQSFLFLIFMVFLVGIVSSVSQSFSGQAEDGPSIVVPNGGALVLNPQGVLVETAPPGDTFADAFSAALGMSVDTQISIHDMVRVVRTAAKDDRIAALVIDLQQLYIPSGAASKAYYLADEIEKFRATGKPVVAIADYYTQEQYLVASEADTILMHDFGALDVSGYGAYGMYYKSALEKLKVNAHVFRVGTFKAAVEPYLRDDMSPEAKEANSAFLGVLWDTYTARVDENRNLPSGATDAFTDNMPDLLRAAGGDMGQLAVDAGYVDQLVDRDGQNAFIANLVGTSKKSEIGAFKGVSYRTYFHSVPQKSTRDNADKVAIITAAGTIVDGDEPVGVVAGDYLSRKIREARFRDDIKALVLRVDSPGGSAFASELIRDELLAFKATGRPLVVSMGSLAASGGYWISANADEIWAAPTTLTGSIGVFGLATTFEDSLAELGVYVDGVGTTPLSASAATGLGPLPEALSEVIQASVEQTYDRFLDIAAEGRGMTPAGVDAVGQGRIWAGETAVGLGLVDKLGTIDDAVAAAASLAQLDDYDVTGLIAPKSRFEMFLEEIAGAEADVDPAIAASVFDGSATASSPIGRMTRQVAAQVRDIASYNDPKAAYVRCIGCLPIN